MYTREVVQSTLVEVTRAGETLDMWLPRGEGFVPIHDCDGWWAGPLETPNR